MQEKLSLLQRSGGEVETQLQTELEQSQKECADLKAQLSALTQTLHYEREKMLSLESTMSNLTSGNEEMIAREKAAAEERAAQQRERETQHNLEVQALADQAKNTELRLKTDLNHLKQEFQRKQGELKDEHDQARRAKDREIDTLQRFDLVPRFYVFKGF
jgi:chromosome segregation ATPase